MVDARRSSPESLSADADRSPGLCRPSDVDDPPVREPVDSGPGSERQPLHQPAERVRLSRLVGVDDDSAAFDFVDDLVGLPIVELPEDGRVVALDNHQSGIVDGRRDGLRIVVVQHGRADRDGEQLREFVVVPVDGVGLALGGVGLQRSDQFDLGIGRSRDSVGHPYLQWGERSLIRDQRDRLDAVESVGVDQQQVTGRMAGNPVDVASEHAIADGFTAGHQEVRFVVAGEIHDGVAGVVADDFPVFDGDIEFVL